jgi:hypothetical protein
MKIAIGTQVFGIFNNQIHPAEVKKQSKLYKEYIRLNLYNQNLITSGRTVVPLIVDLHPGDVFEDEDAAKKALFERKLRGATRRLSYEARLDGENDE